MELIERFWSHVDRSGGPDACWSWLLSCEKDGYGHMRDGKKLIRAYAFAFELEHGYRPPMACHICDMPRCCNQLHSFAGNAKINVEDMVSKMRHTHGEKSAKAKLTAEQVLFADTHYVPKHPVYGYTAMANDFGVSPQSLHLTITEKQWAYLGEAA